jgi:hypothetical protein
MATAAVLLKPLLCRPSHCAVSHQHTQGPVFARTHAPAAGLAAVSARHTTSIIFSHDPVPRLTPVAVQRLRSELLQVDWAGQLKARLLDAEYTQVRLE